MNARTKLPLCRSQLCNLNGLHEHDGRTYDGHARFLPAIEIDKHTKAGHERFKSTVVFDCSDGKPRTMNQWLEWMKTWDPLSRPSEKADQVRARLEAERRGPGISRRPR